MATHIAIAICITIEITMNNSNGMISKFGRKNTNAIYKITKKGLWIVQLHNFSLHPKAGVILTRGQAKLSPEAGIPCLHSANLNLGSIRVYSLYRMYFTRRQNKFMKSHIAHA